MKTYKQLYKEANRKYSRHFEDYQKMSNYACQLEKTLKDNHVINPIIFHDTCEKLKLAISGLKAIRAVAPNESNSSMIADEVLCQLGENT